MVCRGCVLKPCTNYTQTLHGTLHKTLHGTLHFVILKTTHANGAGVLLVVVVCQNAHFGFTFEGASEWLRCKALRMRAQGVKYMTKPESDSNEADWLL